jgi:hypothetical protein
MNLWMFYDENLCKRCALDMGCSATDTESNRGWECSRRRVNGCVSDNSGAEEEEEGQMGEGIAPGEPIHLTNFSVQNITIRDSSEALALIIGQKSSFLLNDAETRVMNTLSPKFGETSFTGLVAKLLSKGDNTIYLLLINQGDGPYTPYTFTMEIKLVDKLILQKFLFIGLGLITSSLKI